MITLNPSEIARALAKIAFLLAFTSVGGQLAKFWLGYDHLNGLIPLFDVDGEQNVPAFFSVLLLLFAALLLEVIAILNRTLRTFHTSKWAILSFGFLLMAYDEAFQVHEKLISPVRKLLGGGNLGVFYFAWVIPGIALVFVLALFFLRFLMHLPAVSRLNFVIAAALYLGGAIGFEMIGGRYAELHGENNLTYSVIVTVEESIEMAGLIVFIRALLLYIADNHEEVRSRFGGSRPEGTIGAPEAQPGSTPPVTERR